jgi:hypothetical protein
MEIKKTTKPYPAELRERAVRLSHHSDGRLHFHQEAPRRPCSP